MAEKGKSGLFKIAAVVVIAGAVLYGYTRYNAKSSEQKTDAAVQQQAQNEIIVPVEEVEKTDASSIVSSYVGKVEAIQSVQVKPQIAGLIDAVCFREGSIVKAGATLFKIESSQFEAAVEVSRAELARAEANLTTAEKYFARVKAADTKAVSAADRDKAECDVLAGKAAVAQAKAALRTAEINLGYCTVKAPITGKIGRAEQTKGNYVSSEGASLASIVQMDPIRITYTLPDKDYLNLLEKFKTNGAVFNTKIILPNGKEVEAKGTRDFEDNTVDAATGTIQMRLRFSNAVGNLIPGEMVRVLTNPAESRIVNVIPLEAVCFSEQGNYVFKVGAENKVQNVPVKLGAEIGSKIEVISGLVEGDKVVTAGMQSLRPGMTVKIATNKAESAAKTAAEDAPEAETAKDAAAKEAK